MCEDVKKEWMNVIRRAQQVAETGGNKGAAVVTVRIIIDADLNPVGWTVEQVKVDPKKNVKEILDILT